MPSQRQSHPLLDFTLRFMEFLGREVFVPDFELRWLAAQVPTWARPIVELEAWQRAPNGLDKPTVDRLAMEIDGLLHGAHSSPEVAQVFAVAGAALVRAMAKASFETGVAQTALRKGLDDLALLGAAHDDTVKLARFILLEGIYDARRTEIEHAVLLEKSERRLKAQELLDFVDKELEPARNDRARVLGTLTSQQSQRDLELLRMEIAQVHRRLSWSTAVAAATDGAPIDNPRDWKALADRYRRELADEADALGATSNGLERFVEVLEASSERMSEIGDEVRALLDEITDERVAQVPDRESRLEIIKVMVRSLLVLDRNERAVERIRQVAAETKSDLDIANDEFRRSFLLRDSDDWLGLAAMAGGDALVREIYPVFRRTPLTTAQPSADEVFITPLLGRHRAAILVAEGGPIKVIEVARAHDIARVLRSLHEHASKDIAAYNENIETEPRWRDLLQRLAGMLGNDRLREAVRGKHVHVFAGGSAVHVPWSGLFVMLAVDVKSVVARLVGAKAGAAGPLSAGAAAVINGFASGEHWDKALKDLAVSNGAAEWKPSQPPAHLELLLLGAHGGRSPFGELSIHPTSGRLPARDFAAGAPSARTVFCGICYAGGGFLSGAGDWESMPALLLARGSERVLANTWPAWDLPATRTAFVQVLRRMRAGSVRMAAEELFKWQTSQGATHPRWWSGWTLWVGEDLA